MVWLCLLPYGNLVVSNWDAPVSVLLFKAAALPFLLLGHCSFSRVELVQRVDGLGKGGGWGQKRACSRSYASQFSWLLRSFSLEVSPGCLRRQQVAVLHKMSTNYVLGLMPLIWSPLPSPSFYPCQKEKTTLAVGGDHDQTLKRTPNRVSAGVRSCWKVWAAGYHLLFPVSALLGI